jgi:hypothetical protein
MIRIALVALVAAQGTDGVTLRYPAAKGPKDKVYTETQMTLKIEGTEQAVNFVRSLEPFLSLEKLQLRADGHRTADGKKVRIEHDESRVELRYDDEDHELDYAKGQVPPADLDKNKLKQLLWFLAAAGRSYSLTPEGEYKSDDANQDHNGEAMDLIALAVVRMPDKPVREGDTWEKAWKGARSEKKKQGKFDYTQKVKVEKLEEKDGKKVATLAADLTGKLNQPPGERDANAEEAWTKVEGKMRTVIEVETGRVLSSEGQGKVLAYYRAPAENGGKNEITLTFAIAGKTTVK